MSVQVVHGRRPGPALFVSAAVHGDEIIGVEIVRRLLRTPSLERLQGTLLAIPIVNAFGFHEPLALSARPARSQPLLPRQCPRLLAARLAQLFMTEIVARCDFGIDLHSAAIHRTNLPQIRLSPRRPETMELALAFGAPVILTSKLREGSLRLAARERGVDILLYEAGEALRFDEFAVRTGVLGVLRVMRHLGMVPAKGIARPKVAPILSTASTWLRAPAGGLLRTFKSIGEKVEAGDVLGVVADPFGEVETEVVAAAPGLVIGRTNLPVVNEGDGLFHIAEIRHDDPEATIGSLAHQLEGAALFDEDEII